MRNELEQVTPYNTYVVEGLPPGPICNPGRAAMEAVANPSRTKELYFVADGSGGHAFAETLDQHVKNVQRWRQIEKDAKDRAGPEADKLLAPTPTLAPGQKSEATPANLGPFGSLPAGFANSPEAGAKAAGQPPPAGGQPGKGKPPNRAQATKATDPVKPSPPNGSAPAVTSPPGPPAPTPSPAPASAPQASTAASPPRPSNVDAYSLGPPVDELGLDIPGMPPPASAADNDADMADLGAANGPIASYPVSPARRAELKARALQYGLDPGSDTLPADAVASAAAPSGAKRKYLDASEGTRLDPLLNKTYDLNSAKVVPPLP
jgi:UPF0755 protein